MASYNTRDGAYRASSVPNESQPNSPICPQLQWRKGVFQKKEISIASVIKARYPTSYCPDGCDHRGIETLYKDAHKLNSQFDPGYRPVRDQRWPIATIYRPEYIDSKLLMLMLSYDGKSRLIRLKHLPHLPNVPAILRVFQEMNASWIITSHDGGIQDKFHVVLRRKGIATYPHLTIVATRQAPPVAAYWPSLQLTPSSCGWGVPMRRPQATGISWDAVCSVVTWRYSACLRSINCFAVKASCLGQQCHQPGKKLGSSKVCPPMHP